MEKDGLQRVIDFLEFLREKNIDYRIDQQQPEAIMVTVPLVGIRIEAEFFVDHVEYSIFSGKEDVENDERALRDFIAQNWRD